MDWVPTDQFQRFVATFRPKNLATLRPEVSKLIGVRCIFHTAWLIDEGAYKGQWACMTFSPSFEAGWVPFEDFEDVEKFTPEGVEEVGNDLLGEVKVSGGDEPA